MSTILETTPTVDRRPRTTTWRDVLQGAATGQVVMAAFMFLITLVFEGRVDPMPVVIGAVAAGGVALLRRRPGRGGVVYAGVVSLLLLLMVAMFGGLTVFSRPESTFELILFGGLSVVTILGLVATVGAWRRAAGPTAEVAPKVAGAFLGLLVVVGVLAGGLTGSATRMAGDVSVQARNFEFSEETIEVEAGRVAVFVDNEDVASHDFSIEGVVSEAIPGQKAGRAVFTVDAGTYRFYCSLHPGMEGTLKAS